MSDILWAPWRIEYIKKVSTGPESCFLCEVAQNPQKDTSQLVLHRSASGLLMMNLYPYVNGHLLVVPYRHTADLPDLTPEERSAMMELAQFGQQLLTGAMNPQGFNIGINIGRCAGAGVPGHVHMHVVPRWNGDVNFMSVVGRVRVIPQAVQEAYAQLVQEHQRISSHEQIKRPT
jgi:ATP adenylyltransferase